MMAKKKEVVPWPPEQQMQAFLDSQWSAKMELGATWNDLYSDLIMAFPQ